MTKWVSGSTNNIFELLSVAPIISAICFLKRCIFWLGGTVSKKVKFGHIYWRAVSNFMDFHWFSIFFHFIRIFSILPILADSPDMSKAATREKSKNKWKKKVKKFWKCMKIVKFTLKIYHFFLIFKTQLFNFFHIPFLKIHLLRKQISEMKGAKLRNAKMKLLYRETHFVTLHFSTQSGPKSEDHPVHSYYVGEFCRVVHNFFGDGGYFFNE